MMFDIQDLLIILVEMICCKIFYETFASRKEIKAYLSYAIVLVLAIIVYVLSYLMEDYFIGKEILVIMIISLLMKLYLKLKMLKSIVLAILYISIMAVVDYCGFSLISYLFGSYEEISEQYQAGGKIVIVFCKICLFLTVTIISRNMKHKSEESLEDNEWIRFLCFPIFTMIIIAAMVSNSKYVTEPEQGNLLFIMAFGLVGMNIFVFFLINDILSREKKIRNDKVLLLEMRNQVNVYQSISDNFNTQKKKTHEYKNQIMCIEGLLLQGNFEKVQEYVQNISEVLAHELDSINTNHAIINAVLNTKYQEAEDKNIVLVIKVNDLSQIWMKDEDIVVILSNLLDNAIEATEKCTSKRIVYLKFTIDNEIVLSVKNSYVIEPKIINGIPVTSKREKDVHGIGTKNIIDLVNKYNGSYIIKRKDKEFLFSILIPKQ